MNVSKETVGLCKEHQSFPDTLAATFHRSREGPLRCILMFGLGRLMTNSMPKGTKDIFYSSRAKCGTGTGVLWSVT